MERHEAACVPHEGSVGRAGAMLGIHSPHLDLNVYREM